MVRQNRRAVGVLVLACSSALCAQTSPATEAPLRYSIVPVHGSTAGGTLGEPAHSEREFGVEASSVTKELDVIERGVQPPCVAWDSPSTDALGSMPLGNGDIALNAWVDPSGDLLFYIGKSDAWEDNGRLAKVGRVRLRLNPGLLTAGRVFRQVLDPLRGEMVVRAGTPDGASAAQLRVWVDANHPVIHVAVQSTHLVTARASLELWRNASEPLASIEASDVLLDRSVPTGQVAPTVVEPDTVLRSRDLPDGIGWLHHNRKSVGPVETMGFQDLLESPWNDPLRDRIFGAWIRADGAHRIGDRHLECHAAKQHLLSIYVLTQQPTTPSLWTEAMRKTAADVEAIAPCVREAAHRQWWREFWDRSYIAVTPRAGSGDASAEDVSRGYALQRFITACAGRGAYPIKFNGSLFNTPWPDKPGDADYRRWGPGFWWQNTRLIYEGLCASGDFDLQMPLYRMYGGEILRVSKYRTKHYFGFDNAAYLPETMYLWGAVFAETYGRQVPAAQRSDKLQASGWHKREWVGGLELAFLMQDYYDYTGDEQFLEAVLLPTAMPVVRFFDQYYKTGNDGKLLMHPAQALETWWNCTNPMPEVAGLHAVVGRLLALPEGRLPAADRTYLQTLQSKLPDLPTRDVDGVKMLAPAAKFADKRNCENPELYAVFPFRLVSFEKPTAQLGIQALHHRTDKGASGWRQDGIFMAYLGLADEAKRNVIERARKTDVACRFPAFWGPNYDWTPDQCHGGVLMKALQAMLLQTEGEKILLLPAWPAEWDVRFKLHAPGRTTIEATVRDGKVQSLTVMPESRRNDVVCSLPVVEARVAAASRGPARKQVELHLERKP